MSARSLVACVDGLKFNCLYSNAAAAFLAQLVEHALREGMVMGSIPKNQAGGLGP